MVHLVQWFSLLPITVKLEAAVLGLAGTILAQEVPIGPADSPVLQWLDLGVTVAALGLLGYILRLVFSGGLVSKPLIEQVVEHTVKEVMKDIKDLK